jgi:MFS family permease
MVPYQITFGLASGFVNYYVNRVIVSGSVGDGYIGLLSALSTLAAVVLAFPLASIANRYESGKYYVMVFGGMCFVYGGLSILLFNESHMGNWAFLLTYFIIHGAARGVWESTNKAVISSYFSDESTRNAAFATVYFTSGLSATFGFLCYQFLTKFWLSLVNTVIPLFAMFCYHYSHKLAVYRCIDLEPLPVTVVSIVNPVINDSVLIDESEGGIGKRYESTTTNRTSLTNSTHYTATPTEDVDNSVTSRTNRQLK